MVVVFCSVTKVTECSPIFLLQVHFFNSFFHRQLVAKGYEGVKRWTKKVSWW